MGLTVNDVSGIGAVSGFLKDIADKIWPDPAERDQYLLKAQELDNQLAQGQAAVNQVEAASNRLFVSGWRPWIGWCCGTAFVWSHIIQPIVVFIMTANGHPIALPALDNTGDNILLGILGVNGAFRTVEKMSDKAQMPWQK